MITLNLFTSGKHTQPLIKVLQKAKNIKLVNIYSKLSDFPDLPDKTDVFIIADFGQIVPKKVLAIPKRGSLCVHPSLLPKYRGASPVQYTIMNGEKETGVTIIKMDEKVDHGPIIAQFKEKIRDDDTAESLYERLFAAGAQVLVTILPAWIEGRIEPRQQNHSKATYTKILTRQDGFVSPGNLKEALEGKSESKAVEIERKIRAFYPWPGAWIETQLATRNSQFAIKKLKLLKVHLEKSPITDHRSPIAKLVLDEVQLEGKKPVSWKQFMEGYPKAKFA